MNCIVTAGPTYEALDEVRRLINFSTGRLGSGLASFLTSQGHKVTLLIGEHATWRGEQNAAHVETFSHTVTLLEKLRAARDVQAVFHAAAVADFKFGKVWERSSSGELIEIKARKIPTGSTNLLAELVPTPKILQELRGLFPTAFLVGWKYEVDGDKFSVLRKAEMQIQQNRTNLCVANGPAYGRGFGVVSKEGNVEHCKTMETLFEALHNGWRNCAVH
jgi:phosphopantothenoylcysteine decarboxylase/phosphopantothenate--cysteine ligase